jgi:cell volume regulation protein A
MQIAMFLTLGLLVFPSHLQPVMGTGLLVSLFLMVVARPASVFLTMFFTDLKWRELLMISWVGLRGAVPIILATFPLLAGVPQAEMIFNLVFFIVITSVLLQGTTLPLVARLLRVDAPMDIERPVEVVDAEELRARNKMVEIRIPGDSPAAGKRIVELGLPKEALVLLIDRGDEVVTPRGSTHIEAGDTMLVLADKQSRDRVREILGSPHRTETGPEEATMQ